MNKNIGVDFYNKSQRDEYIVTSMFIAFSFVVMMCSFLLIHGVFFISCLILPMLGVFRPGMSGGEWIGTAVLMFWCIYFIPVGILSVKYFKDAD